jgi:hypothetical protein
VAKEDAVDGNFGPGGEGGAGGAGALGASGVLGRGVIERMKASRSAYMLAYVRCGKMSPTPPAKEPCIAPKTELLSACPGLVSQSYLALESKRALL